MLAGDQVTIEKVDGRWVAAHAYHQEPAVGETAEADSLEEMGVRDPEPPVGEAAAQVTTLGSTMFYCDNCGREFKSKASVSQHFRHSHAGQQVAFTKKAAVNVIANPSPAPAGELEQAATEVAGTVAVNGVDLSFLNPNGLKTFDSASKALHASPALNVAFVGPTGLGKSAITTLIAQASPWDGRYMSDGCHDGMDIESLVGSTWPGGEGEGLTVWRDGNITAAMRAGAVYHLEEMANAPSEMLSRLHQVMDEGEMRYLSLPESAERRVEIHPNFRYVASWNPPGRGYASNRLTDPVLSRFAVFIELRKPIVNEKAVIRQYVSNDLANRIMRLVTDLRENDDTYVTTRDVKLFAQVLASGITPLDAAEMSFVPKVKRLDASTTVKNLAKISFDPKSSVEEYQEPSYV
jgi:hypothetical protein